VRRSRLSHSSFLSGASSLGQRCGGVRGNHGLTGKALERIARGRSAALRPQAPPVFEAMRRLR
jgi:hypothetical protein